MKNRERLKSSSLKWLSAMSIALRMAITFGREDVGNAVKTVSQQQW
jgi:hypothetical protein